MPLVSFTHQNNSTKAGMEPTSPANTVFYSWQSDTPNGVNRSFIERALEKAITAIGKNTELSPALRVELDQGIKGVTGSPPIAETILAKIQSCTAFVADLTLVGESLKELVGPGDAPRRFPNPNVLIEYGYALHARTDKAVVAVMNTAYGEPADLPFDLRHKNWPIRYQLKDPQDPEKPAKLEELARTLEKALREILSEHQATFSEAERRRRKEAEARAIERLGETAERFEREEPEKAKRPHMLLTAVAEESVEAEQDWNHAGAYALVNRLCWGKVSEYGRKNLNNSWVETAGSYQMRPERPETLVRVWDNWAVTATGEFWMYKAPRPGEPGEHDSFAAETWEDETMAFVPQLIARMQQKWPTSRIFLQLRGLRMKDHLVLYSSHIVKGRIGKDLESKVVTVEPSCPVNLEPLIGTLWFSLGQEQSPRHSKLFPQTNREA